MLGAASEIPGGLVHQPRLALDGGAGPGDVGDKGRERSDGVVDVRLEFGEGTGEFSVHPDVEAAIGHPSQHPRGLADSDIDGFQETINAARHGIELRLVEFALDPAGEIALRCRLHDAADRRREVFEYALALGGLPHARLLFDLRVTLGTGVFLALALRGGVGLARRALAILERVRAEYGECARHCADLGFGIRARDLETEITVRETRH